MGINIQVSPTYQGVVEQAGGPQHSTINKMSTDIYDTVAALQAAHAASPLPQGQYMVNGSATVYVSDGTTITAGSGGAVTSVAGRTGDVVLTKSDVGLSNIDNTSDVNKPVSTAAQTALNLKTDQLNTLSATTYNPDGTIAAATINGVVWTFAYVGGKLSTVSKAGVLQHTYTWTGNNLTGVA